MLRGARALPSRAATVQTLAKTMRAALNLAQSMLSHLEFLLARLEGCAHIRKRRLDKESLGDVSCACDRSLFGKGKMHTFFSKKNVA